MFSAWSKLPPPIEDQLERFLVLLFLRRYVTWCARTRRFAAMNGAARLHLSPDQEDAAAYGRITFELELGAFDQPVTISAPPADQTCRSTPCR